MPTPVGKLFQTNGQQYGKSGDRRLDAKHVKALDDLVALGLVSDNSGEGKFLAVTAKGFEMVDTHLQSSL